MIFFSKCFLQVQAQGMYLSLHLSHLSVRYHMPSRLQVQAQGMSLGPDLAYGLVLSSASNYLWMCLVYLCGVPRRRTSRGAGRGWGGVGGRWGSGRVGPGEEGVGENTHDLIIVQRAWEHLNAAAHAVASRPTKVDKGSLRPKQQTGRPDAQTRKQDRRCGRLGARAGAVAPAHDSGAVKRLGAREE